MSEGRIVVRVLNEARPGFHHAARNFAAIRRAAEASFLRRATNSPSFMFSQLASSICLACSSVATASLSSHCAKKLHS